MTDRIPALRASAWLVFMFGVLVAANAAVAVALARATSGEVAFALGVFLMASVVATSLRRSARWAWWASLAFAVGGLFFVLPVTGSVLLGSTLEPVGTGWDVVFFPLTAVVLSALLVALWTLRRTLVFRSDVPLEGT
jgi:hypothetical protein